MLYTQKTFTLPSSGNRTSQMKWDRIFLSAEEFAKKYGEKALDAIGEAIGEAKFDQ